MSKDIGKIARTAGYISALAAVGVAMNVRVAYGQEFGLTLQDYLNKLPYDKVIEMPCNPNEKCKTREYVKRRVPKTGKDEVIFRDDVMKTRTGKWARADMSLPNIRAIATAYEEFQKSQKPEEKGKETTKVEKGYGKEPQKTEDILNQKTEDTLKILGEAVDTHEGRLTELEDKFGGETEAGAKPGKPDEKDESIWTLGLGVGGDSKNRGYVEASSVWNIGENSGLGIFLRGYSNVPTEEGKPHIRTTLVDEALVGPGVYRTRTDTIKNETDTQRGNVEAGIIWEYNINPFFKIVARIGDIQEKETKYQTLNSTVRFEDGSGQQIGDAETAITEIKPKEKTNDIATGTIGAGLNMTNNLSLEGSLNVTEGEDPKFEAQLNWRF